jgi:hypothetical protein
MKIIHKSKTKLIRINLIQEGTLVFLNVESTFYRFDFLARNQASKTLKSAYKLPDSVGKESNVYER